MSDDDAARTLALNENLAKQVLERHAKEMFEALKALDDAPSPSAGDKAYDEATILYHRIKRELDAVKLRPQDVLWGTKSITFKTGFRCIRCMQEGKDGEQHQHGVGRCAKVAAVRIFDGDKDITPEGLWAP